MKFFSTSFSLVSNAKMYAILALRSEVFVVEQNCAYQDLDGKDQGSHWVWAEDEWGVVHATARILPPGVSYTEVSIGRVCTSLTARRTGLGRELMTVCLNEISEKYSNAEVVISAQTYLEKFYNEFGFISEGEGYEEDGIPHIKMRKSTW